MKSSEELPVAIQTLYEPKFKKRLAKQSSAKQEKDHIQQKRYKPVEFNCEINMKIEDPDSPYDHLVKTR